MQKIVIEAELSYERAQDMTMELARQGFSVSSKAEGARWTIAAMRAIDPELERAAASQLQAAGIAP